MLSKAEQEPNLKREHSGTDHLSSSSASTLGTLPSSSNQIANTVASASTSTIIVKSSSSLPPSPRTFLMLSSSRLQHLPQVSPLNSSLTFAPISASTSSPHMTNLAHTSSSSALCSLPAAQSEQFSSSSHITSPSQSLATSPSVSKASLFSSSPQLQHQHSAHQTLTSSASTFSAAALFTKPLPVPPGMYDSIQSSYQPLAHATASSAPSASKITMTHAHGA